MIDLLLYDAIHEMRSKKDGYPEICWNGPFTNWAEDCYIIILYILNRIFFLPCF